MASLPATQSAVVLPGKRLPYALATIPVYAPAPGEVTIRVAWTASSPLDLHRADGGLLISSYPHQTGSGGLAGTVVAANPGSAADASDLKGLQVGDRVMGFAFRGDREANHQEYVTAPAYVFSKLPAGLSLPAAVTIPVNLVTVFHAATADLDMQLPWPIPQGYVPDGADEPILVWGASGSVGIFALQVLRHWGYKNVVAVASGKHHDWLKTLGATACFDYNKPSAVEEIQSYLQSHGANPVRRILDCIGSLKGTLEPLSHLAGNGTRVAVMLPVIVKDATAKTEPEYEMDVEECLKGQWKDGVILRGVRTHFYLQNELFKEKLQSEIIPALIKDGAVTPNNQRVVEGNDVLERAQNALDLLRERAVSGERLVWRVAENE